MTAPKIEKRQRINKGKIVGCFLPYLSIKKENSAPIISNVKAKAV